MGCTEFRGVGCVAGMEKQSLDLSQPLLFADLIATEYRCQRLWIVNPFENLTPRALRTRHLLTVAQLALVFSPIMRQLLLSN